MIEFHQYGDDTIVISDLFLIYRCSFHLDVRQRSAQVPDGRGVGVSN